MVKWNVVLGMFLTLTLCQGSTRALDNDTKDVEVKIAAPLEAVDSAVPPTSIKVLGLTVAVTPATVIGAQQQAAGTDSAHALIAGNTVEVSLAGNVAPLSALSIEPTGGYDGAIKIRAPLDALDALAQTITVLGLKIAITTATLGGDNNQPAHLADFAVGQFVGVTLDKASYLKGALVAVSIEMEGSDTGVEVDVNEPDNGTQETNNDVTEVDVNETVSVESQGDNNNGENKLLAQASKKPHLTPKSIHMHLTTSGKSFSLNGLLPGKAQITVTRHGKTSTKRVTIKRNTHKKLKIRLRG